MVPHKEDILKINSDNEGNLKQYCRIYFAMPSKNDETIKITATTVRVPVKYGHSVSINIELENPFELEEVFKLLENADGIIVQDNLENNIYHNLYWLFYATIPNTRLFLISNQGFLPRRHFLVYP